jgi:hypothetical protein
MGDTEIYRFTFTRDVSELDRARRAWAKASGWRRRQLGFGTVMVACGLILFALVLQASEARDRSTDLVVAAAVLVWGLGLLTGASDSLALRVQAKRFPAWTSERKCLVSPSSVLIGAPGIETHLDWSAIAHVVVLDDMVVLVLKDQPGFHYLPRRALEHDDQWPDFVRLLPGWQEQNSRITRSGTLPSRARLVIPLALVVLIGFGVAIVVNSSRSADPKELANRLSKDGICDEVTLIQTDRGNVYSCLDRLGHTVKVASPSTPFIYLTTDYRVDGTGWMAVAAEKETAERVAGLLGGRLEGG